MKSDLPQHLSRANRESIVKPIDILVPIAKQRVFPVFLLRVCFIQINEVFRALMDTR